jgi:hypothetical protein
MRFLDGKNQEDLDVIVAKFKELVCKDVSTINLFKSLDDVIYEYSNLFVSGEMCGDKIYSDAVYYLRRLRDLFRDI